MVENIHRRTKLGETLNDTLDEMISRNMITNQIKEDILKGFDKIMLQIFKTIKNKITIKGSIFDYGNCDNVWDFNLKDVKLNYDSEVNTALPLLKIIALDYSKITNTESLDKSKKNNIKAKSNLKKNKK